MMCTGQIKAAGFTVRVASFWLIAVVRSSEATSCFLAARALQRCRRVRGRISTIPSLLLEDVGSVSLFRPICRNGAGHVQLGFLR